MDKNEQIEEQMIVMQAQLGSDEAFERLIQRYHARLTYYIRRLTGSVEASEDVLQSVWLNAYKNLPKLRHTEAFRVWIYRIAHNQSMKSLRHDQRYVQLDEPRIETFEDESTNEFTIYDSVSIHHALNQLSPPHKEVLTLRFLEDLTYQEIADVIGSEIGTVRSRIYYAKEHMRKILEENGNE